MSGCWSGTGREQSICGDFTGNDISLPVEDGDFATRLFSVTIPGAVSRSLFANALIRYDDVSNVVQAHVGIDWIHTPGLFIVFDMGYLTSDLLDPGSNAVSGLTDVVKLTYLKTSDGLPRAQATIDPCLHCSFPRGPACER